MRRERVLACDRCRGTGYLRGEHGFHEVCDECGEDCGHWPEECGSPLACVCTCEDCKEAFRARTALHREHQEAADLGH